MRQSMEKDPQMTTKNAKELPAGIRMACYACGDQQATHVCRYQVEDLKVQVCLCGRCMKMDTDDLIKNTLGIEAPSETSTQDFIVQ